jgi:Synergist-CTERM protein sorting domain-containing protein
VSRSFQTWAAQFASCGNLTLVEGARVADRQTGYEPAGSNRNLVLFRMQDCSAVVPTADVCLGDGSCANKYDCWDFGRDTIGITTVSYDVRTGVIYDADIELNGRFNFTTVDSPRCVGTSTSQSCVSTDVQNTVTHEAGHFIGLDHTLASGSVMNPEASSGEISKRQLDSGSAGFVCEVYPRAKASVSCVDRGVTQPPSGGDSDGGCASTGALGAVGALLLLLPVLRRRRQEQP